MTFPLSGQASAAPDIMGNERRLFFARGALLIPIGFASVARPLPGYVCRPGHIFSASFLVCFLPGVMLSLVTPPSIRSVAPLVGVSMFLSAGVVGVILAGMSFGNALGGNLATRYGSHHTLRWSLMVSGIATLAVAPLWKLAVSSGLFHQMSLIPQILCWSFSLFFLPALAFGDSGCGERFFSAISSDDGRIQLADSATAAASGRVSSNRDRRDGIRPLYGLGCADRRKIVW
jgi:hypothetical protein